MGKVGLAMGKRRKVVRLERGKRGIGSEDSSFFDCFSFVLFTFLFCQLIRGSSLEHLFSLIDVWVRHKQSSEKKREGLDQEKGKNLRNDSNNMEEQTRRKEKRARKDGSSLDIRTERGDDCYWEEETRNTSVWSKTRLRLLIRKSIVNEGVVVEHSF